MPKPGSGLAAELHRRTQAETEQGEQPTTTRKTKPRKDDAGLVSVRLPAELKQGLESHVAALRAQEEIAGRTLPRAICFTISPYSTLMPAMSQAMWRAQLV